jgi:hypothetical protein
MLVSFDDEALVVAGAVPTVEEGATKLPVLDSLEFLDSLDVFT